MSSMTYVHYLFFYKTYFFFLIKSISCTVTPKNIIYLISKDKTLTFKDLKKKSILRVTYVTTR